LALRAQRQVVADDSDVSARKDNGGKPKKAKWRWYLVPKSMVEADGSTDMLADGSIRVPLDGDKQGGSVRPDKEAIKAAAKDDLKSGRSTRTPAEAYYKARSDTHRRYRIDITKEMNSRGIGHFGGILPSRLAPGLLEAILTLYDKTVSRERYVGFEKRLDHTIDGDASDLSEKGDGKQKSSWYMVTERKIVTKRRGKKAAGTPSLTLRTGATSMTMKRMFNREVMSRRGPCSEEYYGLWRLR
jgi:hypothetical protein